MVSISLHTLSSKIHIDFGSIFLSQFFPRCRCERLTNCHKRACWTCLIELTLISLRPSVIMSVLILHYLHLFFLLFPHPSSQYVCMHSSSQYVCMHSSWCGILLPNGAIFRKGEQFWNLVARGTSLSFACKKGENWREEGRREWNVKVRERESDSPSAVFHKNHSFIFFTHFERLVSRHLVASNGHQCNQYRLYQSSTFFWMYQHSFSAWSCPSNCFEPDTQFFLSKWKFWHSLKNFLWEVGWYIQDWFVSYSQHKVSKYQSGVEQGKLLPLSSEERRMRCGRWSHR